RSEALPPQPIGAAPLANCMASALPRMDSCPSNQPAAVASELRDVPLLRGELVVRLDGALAHPLAGGLQFDAGTLGECFHADRGEQVVGGAELRARIGTPALAAQPLAVEQVRAGEFRTQPRTTQPLDRFAIQALGGLALAQQRARASLDPQAPAGVAGVRCFGESLKRIG